MCNGRDMTNGVMGHGVFHLLPFMSIAIVHV